MNSSARSIVVALLPFLLTVSSCQPAQPPPKEEGSVSSIAGYNYTIEGIQEFSVNGQWGGNMSIGGGGGSYVCCIMLPKKWTPGLSAKVVWERSDCRNDEKRCPKRREDFAKWEMATLAKDVPIEPYERPYTTYVIFLPGDEIKIYVTPVGPDHPDHPFYLGRARPLDHPEWRPYQP